MKQTHFRSLFTMSLVILDTSALVLAFHEAFKTRFAYAWFLRFFPVTKGVPSAALYNQSLLAFLPMWLLVFFYMNFYKENPLSAYDELIRVIKGVIVCSLLTTGITFAYRRAEYSRLAIGLWCMYTVALIYILREIDKYMFRRLLFRSTGPQRVLILGKGKIVQAIQQMAAQQPFLKPLFLESPPTDLQLEDMVAKDQIVEILLVQGGLPSETILETARWCEKMNIECRIVPDILEIRRGEIVVDGFFGLPTFRIKSLSLHGVNYVFKRSFDVLISLLILSLSAFPLLLIGLLIRCDTPGAILYTQERLGYRGQRFRLVKFRTMVINADKLIEKLKPLSERAGPVFKMRNDPRVTRIGRWLRRFSIDELPQLFNVLKGDMSLVGPRPQVLWEAAHYDENAKKRLRMIPGITGLWQVSGRAALSFEEMIDLDIFYLENWSLGLDLKIILRTLPAVFAHEGAY